jgi:uncharacterized protein YecT (DUF1311 family)
MKKLIVLIGLFVAFSASAKDCEEGADNMAMIRDCVLSESNTPVNKAYGELEKTLSGNKEATDALKKSQESWKEFRADTCDYLGVTYKGNGYADDERMNCAVEFNKARVKMLNQYAKQAKASN